jgi:cytochrome c oxidase subunit 2
VRLAVPALAGAAGLAAALGAHLVTGSAGAAEEPRVIRVVARQFAYDPPEIRIRRGERVVIELTSLDRPHGLKSTALGLRLDALPGQTTRTQLVADRVGKYTIVCDVFCGLDHDDMDGHIDVVE